MIRQGNVAGKRGEDPRNDSSEGVKRGKEDHRGIKTRSLIFLVQLQTNDGHKTLNI